MWERYHIGEVVLPPGDGGGEGLGAIGKVPGLGVGADHDPEYIGAQMLQDPVVPQRGALGTRWEVAGRAGAGIAEAHG